MSIVIQVELEFFTGMIIIKIEHDLLITFYVYLVTFLLHFVLI